MFPEITIHKISETNSNFHVTCRSTDGKSLISIFRDGDKKLEGGVGNFCWHRRDE